MDNDKDKTTQNQKDKKLKKSSIIDRYFNKSVIIFLIIMLLLLINNQRQSQQLYQSVKDLNLAYQDIQTENRLLKDKIAEQNGKLDAINTQMENYLKERISKDQFTEIYMQLQELTGMVSEEKKREFYINRIVNIISANNEQLESETIYEIAKNIYETSLKYNFNPFLICALIKVESNFIVDSISDSYAYGLCQVRRFIARELAENIGIKWDGAEKTLLDPEKNIKIGIYYLALLYDDFGDIKLALTAYNQGPFKVQELISQNNEIPDGYTDKILHCYAQYRGFDIEEIDDTLRRDGEK
jgi:soluble lytic murein transglycosylase